MPIFTYKALDINNNVTQATLNAQSREEVARSLGKKNLTPLSIQEVPESSQSDKTLPQVEKMTFCRYVGTMLKSGLAISESIDVLLEEATHPLTKKILNDISYSLNHGQSLSMVFARYPKSFDKFFVTIIRSGEISGTLSDAFFQLEEEIRSEYTLKQTIVGTLMYPAVVFIAMFGIGVLMFFFILPQISKVFLNLKVPLHPATTTMFKITDYIGQNKMYILPSMIIGLIGIALFFRTNTGKRVFLKAISPIPIIRNLIKQMDVARFCRTFSTLMHTGVPVTEALEISMESMSFPGYRKTSQEILNQVISGKSLSEAFKDTKAFPPLLTQMILSGEKSGTLDTSIKDLGIFYEEEVESTVKKATQILEPVLMLLVGVGVGAMILAVIVPIYSVVSNLQAEM